ncbi:MAG: glycosyltransferase family 2 protein [Bryobacteraceae bacterium]|nr:glycosyltransferase family 2 protein [Bryobacteraceae bacterium]
MKLISIVIPVFNEEENIDACYRGICELAVSEPDYRWEFVFTDNHSTDKTFAILTELARNDSRIRVFRFSRNFGYQKSILTGYRNATGDCAVQLDADLQDPPEMVRDFIRLWERGHKVVYGIRRQRREGLVIRATRKLFYRVLAFLSDSHLPVDAGDFRLVDRAILDQLATLRQSRMYIRGRIAEMGFDQVGIEYVRRDRMRGESKFTLSQYFGLAIDAITAHSVVPLRLATWFGLGITVLSLALSAFYIVYATLFAGSWPPGFATLAVLMTGTLGILSLFIGIIGEYLARLFEEIVTRQDVILETTIDPQRDK